MKDVAIRKLYYSISEVSELTGIKAYVLRYWESEFSELRPSKNRAGKRIYRKQDIQTVLLIKKLLYVDKYTIEGARIKLRELLHAAASNGEQGNLDFATDKESEILQIIRKELLEILKILDS